MPMMCPPITSTAFQMCIGNTGMQVACQTRGLTKQSSYQRTIGRPARLLENIKICFQRIIFFINLMRFFIVKTLKMLLISDLWGYPRTTKVQQRLSPSPGKWNRLRPYLSYILQTKQTMRGAKSESESSFSMFWQDFQTCASMAKQIPNFQTCCQNKQSFQNEQEMLTVCKLAMKLTQRKVSSRTCNQRQAQLDINKNAFGMQKYYDQFYYATMRSFSQLNLHFIILAFFLEPDRISLFQQVVRQVQQLLSLFQFVVINVKRASCLLKPIRGNEFKRFLEIIGYSQILVENLQSIWEDKHYKARGVVLVNWLESKVSAGLNSEFKLLRENFLFSWTILKASRKQIKMINHVSMIGCKVTLDCPQFNLCIDKLCVHESPFLFTVPKIVFYLLIPLCLSFANVAGLSGGFIKLLVLINLLNYDQIRATYITYSFNVAGALVNSLLLLFSKHPIQPRPIIDFSVCLILLPSLVLGTFIGNLLTRLIPILLSYLLTIIVFCVFNVLVVEDYLKFNQSRTLTLQRIQKYNKNMQLQELSLKNQWWKLLACYLVVLAAISSVNGLFFSVDKCTNTFIIIMLTASTILVLMLMLIINSVRKQSKQLAALGFIDNLQLTCNITVLKLAFTGFLAGFLNGFIAAGAGHVIVFSLVEMGMLQEVASATSALLIFFTCLTAIFQSLIVGLIQWTQVGFYFGLGLVGSLVGTTLIYRLFKSGMPRQVQLLILVAVGYIVAVSSFPAMVFQLKYYGLDYLTKAVGFICK